MTPFNMAFTVLPYLLNDFRDVKTAKSVHNEPVGFLVNIFILFIYSIFLWRTDCLWIVNGMHVRLHEKSSKIKAMVSFRKERTDGSLLQR